MLDGEYSWGSEAEKDTIHTRLHSVRGHIRLLPATWSPSDEAKQRAREYGISLPPGCTFVKPFIRGRDPNTGQSENEQQEPTRIKAIGLANLITLLDAYKLNENEESEQKE
jgi:hypothetical protein